MTRRQYAPVSPPVALTIAGSDSGGGAGIQADLKTMEAHDVFGTSVLTATTAQNTAGVADVHVLPTDHIAAQYDAVGDFEPKAIKTGMLATADVIETVDDCLAGFAGPVVVDPVMVAATGDRLLSEAGEAAYEALLARATLVTPNTDEAEILTGLDVDSAADAEAAGHELLEMGVDAALVKGGHLAGDRVVDTLVVGDGGREASRHVERFSHPRIDTDATHGSGCTLSSAIAARLARGEPLLAAVERGVAFMERAVRYGIDAGSGPGSVHHLVGLRDRAARVDATAAANRLAARLAGRVADAESDAADDDREVDVALARLSPDGGFRVVAATPYAEISEETVTPTRQAADPPLAAGLLAAREVDPALELAVRCRYDREIAAALGAIEWSVLDVNLASASDALAEESTSPTAILARKQADESPRLFVVASDTETVTGRLDALAAAVSTDTDR